jgi:hypothetical protein
VNFTNVSNAIKAIDGVKNKPDYANLRIAHGKDRCANPPRSGPQGASGARRSASGNGPNSPNAIDGDIETELQVTEAAAYEEVELAEGGIAPGPEIKQEMHIDSAIEASA